MKKTKELVKKIVNKSHAIATTGAVVVADLSQVISSADFFKNFNTYKSELSKAMDEGFKIGTQDIETNFPFSPNNHRILDGGHGLFESIEKAKEVGTAEGWSNLETFDHWWKAYFTDMSSPAGMPLFDCATDNIYHFLRDTLNFNEKLARDLVTINGQEATEALLGGTLTAVSLAFAWKKQDKEAFSKAIGSIGLGAIISANPTVLVMLVLAAAFGYNSLVCQKAVQRGGVLSLVAVGTSALLPGPLFFTALAGVVLATYANKKMGTEFVPLDFLRMMLQKAQDPKARQLMLDEINCLLKKRKMHGVA